MRFLFVLSVFWVLKWISAKSTLIIDEQSVCTVKTSCVGCMLLPHCSWCGETQKCFSTNLPGLEDYCKNNVTTYVDYGMSIEENAECRCLSEELKQNCRSPDSPDAPECSARGKCECGRCVCHRPDPDHPSKVIVGEYCEYDNFSCDGPACNEGPYHYINQSYNEMPLQARNEDPSGN